MEFIAVSFLTERLLCYHRLSRLAKCRERKLIMRYGLTGETDTMNLSRGTEMLLQELNFVPHSDIVKPLVP